jgi:hypothetical protein
VNSFAIRNAPPFTENIKEYRFIFPSIYVFMPVSLSVGDISRFD